ncbi:MAG: ribosome-associated translation inhibitor RaiA [Bacteroidales bacterium]|nr:ribosome-associated translation inhibitor RaiA [Bacteroidales bacterium]MBR6093388.1 ribosome-associated translation inhibitor RaiA [Bacteroidales bacterium]
MKVTINSVHFKADSKLEEFISNKIEKLCGKMDDVQGVEVNLKLDNTDTPENKIADIRIMLKGNDLYSSKQCKTFEEATDKAIDALKNQIEKHKNRFDK